MNREDNDKAQPADAGNPTDDSGTPLAETAPEPDEAGAAGEAERTPVKPIAGPFIIATANRDGRALDEPSRFDPDAHEAVNIYFGIPAQAPVPTQEQLDLQDRIAEVLNTAKRLYLNENGEQKVPFRLVYSRLFRLAQIGLQGENTRPDVAKLALARVVDDLVSSEGPRVKNAHLRRLGRSAIVLGLAFVVLYTVFSYAGEQSIFLRLGIEPPVARCFMVLWVGTFMGVWLSYAIRKADFQLRDLTVSEADFVEPAIRLVFSGLLANIVALFLLLGIIEIRIGSLGLDSFAREPAIALLLGMVLGLNELLLPASVARKSQDLMEKIA